MENQLINEYAQLPAVAENPELDAGADRLNTLKALFSLPSGKWSAIFSLTSFISSFLLLAVQWFFTWIAIAVTLGLVLYMMILPPFFLAIAGSLHAQAVFSLLFLALCITSFAALRGLQKENTPFDLEKLRKAMHMPDTRATGLFACAGLLSPFPLAIVCLSLVGIVKDPAYAIEILKDPYIVWSCVPTLLGALCLYSGIVWRGIYKYYARVYKYAETGEYDANKQPPVAQMTVSIVLSVLTLDVPLLLYMIFTRKWFCCLHAGIVSAQSEQEAARDGYIDVTIE